MRVHVAPRCARGVLRVAGGCVEERDRTLEITPSRCALRAERFAQSRGEGASVHPAVFYAAPKAVVIRGGGVDDPIVEISRFDVRVVDGCGGRT
jgi:hypothetical protein